MRKKSQTTRKLKLYEIYGESTHILDRISYGYQLAKTEKEAENKALDEFREKGVMGEHRFFDPKFSAIEIKCACIEKIN